MTAYPFIKHRNASVKMTNLETVIIEAQQTLIIDSLHAVNTTIAADAKLHLSVYMVKVVGGERVKIPLIQRQLFGANQSRGLLEHEVLYLEIGDALVGVTDFSENSMVVTVSYRELSVVDDVN